MTLSACSNASSAISTPVSTPVNSNSVSSAVSTVLQEVPTCSSSESHSTNVSNVLSTPVSTPRTPTSNSISSAVVCRLGCNYPQAMIKPSAPGARKSAVYAGGHLLIKPMVSHLLLII